jgi:cytochrome c biogenesis protein CcmG/thiol:disulfide interchange protein DsbE
LPSTPSSAPPSDEPPSSEPPARRRFGVAALLLVGVVVLAVIAVVAMVSADDDPSRGSRPVADEKPNPSVEGVAEEGTAAPPFDLARLRGPGRVRLADYRGRPLIVNFWASWCVPCRKEFPLFADARADYSPEELGIVGITYRDLPDDARRFARDHDATWVLAEGGQGDPVAKEYGVRAMPQTFFVDPDGTIVSRYYGAPSRDEFEAEVARIVATGGATPPSGTSG